MSTTSKVLKMTFASDFKERSISVRDPLENLTSAAVDTAMDAILAAGVFNDSYGNPLNKSVKAEYLELTKTGYEVQYPNV